MTSTVCLWPIIKALCMASQFLSFDPSWWHAVNQKQETFLQDYFVKRNELSVFSDKELRSLVSTDHEVLNKFLKDEGFSIQLDRIDDGFGVVSILDVMVEWLYEGEKSTITADNNGEEAKAYPAVSMTAASDGCRVLESSLHVEPIILIKTKSKDVVYITLADKPMEEWQLLDFVRSINVNSLKDISDKYESIKFPMVELDREENVEWLLGMMPRVDDKWYISQALHQTRFKMNVKGARVKSAAAIAMLKSTSVRAKRDLIIDQPFYLWIERPGLSEPVFAAYITESEWKDPQNLDL